MTSQHTITRWEYATRIALVLLVLAVVGIGKFVYEEYVMYRHLACHQTLAAENFNPWVNMANNSYRSAYYSDTYNTCIALSMNWSASPAVEETATSTPDTSVLPFFHITVFNAITGLTIEAFDEDATEEVTEKSLLKMREKIMEKY